MPAHTSADICWLIPVPTIVWLIPVHIYAGSYQCNNWYCQQVHIYWYISYIYMDIGIVTIEVLILYLYIFRALKNLSKLVCQPIISSDHTYSLPGIRS